ncbi:MAG: accessory Sec system translocase SecA2 [Rhodothermaceae bacterium]|nr:accessory Sec system translocase SecA2 [Rhodothermaceae bacterium]
MDITWKERFKNWQGINPIERDLTPYKELLSEITSLESAFTSASNQELQERVRLVKQQIDGGASPKDVCVELFALGREAARRTLNMRPFDVQILAGLALLNGKLIEMKTGEGKTLSAVLPACVQAMAGKGVHILTFNNYLARRDASWMKPIYDFMGLSVGYIQEGQSAKERKQAYSADITYATAKEAGFDYLRMHLARSQEERVQRPFHYAIIDEADSILIDEARVPLVIAGQRQASSTNPYQVATLIQKLQHGADWETDEYQRNVQLTEQGIDRIEAELGCGNLHDDENYLLLTEVNQALHAHALLHRDIDYIVRDQRIEIVDEFTGRVMDDRRWPDGLQAALEAKESIPIQPGGRILGSIPLQFFLKQYPFLAGMTATAESAAEEIMDFYGLNVVPIPSNRTCIREDLPNLIFTHKEAKYKALVQEIHKNHQNGRPILVGTNSVEESEYLAEQLNTHRIPCTVLNAKNDEAEASIVAKAGEQRAVTISTNLAGRGTDIKLGGVDESGRENVVALGGLLVLGTTLHESKRIDDQLRGRAGRQGDPGKSQLYLSLEDDLIKRFRIDELIPAPVVPEYQGTPIDIPLIRNEVARIQRIIEGQNYEIRKTLWKYSKVLEGQRKDFYRKRVDVVESKATLSVFKSALPELYRTVTNRFGEQTAYQVERDVTLHHMDSGWEEHLSQVTHLREGIHLVSLGGLNPLNEFHKHLLEAFETMSDTLDDRISTTLSHLQIAEDGVHLDPTILKGPSSTWTYLINDSATSDLQKSLFGQDSTAFAAGAALMTGPLLIGWGIWKRWKQRREAKKS